MRSRCASSQLRSTGHRRIAPTKMVLSANFRKCRQLSCVALGACAWERELEGERGRWAVGGEIQFKLTSTFACWLGSNALVMHMHGMRVTLLCSPVGCDSAGDDQQTSPSLQRILAQIR